MSWVYVGASAVSAAAGIYGANQAADATGKAANQNADLQRQNWMMQLGITEPQRALGYGAQSDLASLYGYNLPQYQSANQLMNPNSAGGMGGGLITVNGRAATNNYNGGFDVNPFNGGKDAKYGGTIDPYTGTVVVNGDPALSAKYTEYLRTGNVAALGGEVHKNDSGWRMFSSINNLRSSGWQYDPSRAENVNPAGGQGNGQAGNMSRFFASPDYQFRRDEGQRDIGNSFAARGGAASGNALRELARFNSGLASGEFGNYTNRLMRMAGMGESANTQAAQSGQNYTNGMSQANQDQGDARASGILGTTNSIIGGMSDFANYWGSRKQPNTMSGLEDIPIWQKRIPGY